MLGALGAVAGVGGVGSGVAGVRVRISTPPSSSAAVTTAKALDKIGMKHIDAMAAVGDEAAHNAPSLKREDVERLLRDVQEFLVKNPI